MTYRTRFVDKSISVNNSPIKDHTHQHNHIPTTYKNIISCQQSTGYCGVLVFNFRKKCSLQRLRSSKRRKARLPCGCNTLWHSYNFEICCDSHLIQNQQATKLVKESKVLVGRVWMRLFRWGSNELRLSSPFNRIQKTHNVVAYSPGCRSRALWLTNM